MRNDITVDSPALEPLRQWLDKHGAKLDYILRVDDISVITRVRLADGKMGTVKVRLELLARWSAEQLIDYCEKFDYYATKLQKDEPVDIISLF
jgi:hypothetical protein